jgi:autotransporter-associated beta strand protein
VTVNQATLLFDDTGLSANTSRLGSSPLTLAGASLTVLSRQSTQPVYALSSLGLSGGQSTITLTQPAGSGTSGSSLDVTVSSLSRTANSVLNIVGSNAATGLGQPGPNPRLALTGTSNTSGILGGWAVISSTNWATLALNGSGVVGGLGDLGFTPFTTGTTILTAGNAPTANLTDSAARTGIPTTTINSFRLTAGVANTLGTAGTPATLTLASGGLMSISGSSQFTEGATAGGSGITSGTDNLFTFVTSSTLNLAVPIRNNGANPIGLTKSGDGILRLSATANNTYSGTTVVNAGTLLLGGTGNVQVPGNLVIAGNGAAVTMSGTQGQIASTSTVSLLGGGVLTLTGSNTLAGLVFDNLGGSATPTVAVGTGRLTLSGSGAITASNDNPAFTPTISGSSLVFTDANPVITTSGLSPLDLLISGTITSAGGRITKAGVGSLVLSASNTFTTGVNLSAGTLFVDNSAALGTGTLTFTGGNLQSLSGVRTIANPVTVAGDFSLGGSLGTNDIILSGTVDLGASQRTITVADIVSSGTLSGLVTGAGGLTKAGNGLLLLSGTNTFGGPLVINRGTLVTGSITSGGVAGATGTSSADPANLVLGGGRLQYTGATGTTNRGFTLTNSTNSAIDVTTGATNLAFTGPIAASTGGFAKLGSGTLTLTGSSDYTGSTSVSAGTLRIGSAGTTGGIWSSGTILLGLSGTLDFARTDNYGGAYANPITGPGRIQLSSGTLTLTGANDYSGSTNITAGSRLVIGPGGRLFGTGTSSTITNAGTLEFASAEASMVGGVISGTGGLVKGGAGLLTLSGTNIFTGGLTLSAGTLSLDNNAALGGATSRLTILGGALDVTAARTIANNNPQTWNNGFTFLGSNSLNLGTGTVTLGVTPTVTVTSSTLTVGGRIDGTGFGLTKSGAGALLLSASNAYTAATTVNDGTLAIGHAFAMGSGTAALTVNGGRLDLGGLGVSRSGPITLAGGTIASGTLTNTGSALDARSGAIVSALAGAAGLVKTTAGTVVLSGSNTFAGNTTLTEGVLSLESATALGNSGTIGFGGGTLRFAASGTTDYSSRFSSAASQAYNLDVASTGTVTLASPFGGSGGTLAKMGAGTLAIAGTTAYTGNTLVSDGTLVVRGLLNSPLTTVQAGGVLGGSGRLAGGLTGDGLIAPGNSPGILTVTGQLTPTGTTSFAFEFSGTGSPAWNTATASINDVLRLTNADPFTSPLTTGNLVNIYFDVETLANGDVFLGGFYSDSPNELLDFAAEIGSPTYAFYVLGDGSGTSMSYNGKNYYSLANYDPSLMNIAVSVVTVPQANYADGTIYDGQVTQFVIIPEPTSLALAGLGVAIAAWALRRRK